VQTFEQDLPGANTAGFNTKEIGALPLETSLTMNRSWGFNITDRNFKSVTDLVGYLVRAAGNDANLLLNIGPRPDGTIQPEAVERLQQIGAWLQTHGESIYGTRRGPVPPQPWGATTMKGDAVYVHVLDATAQSVTVASTGGKVISAKALGSGADVACTPVGEGVALTLPPPAQGEIDRVVVLRVSR
jgi:alpha-L-fucosidase